MIVIADTSPLNYLIQIRYDDLLPRLYRRVMVPPAVIRELRHTDAPVAVKRWLAAMPTWIDLRSPRPDADATLLSLGDGEREAIQLAEENRAGLLLIDERRGRSAARRRGLLTLGTLGILIEAGGRGWLDPIIAYRLLITETTFRTSPTLESNFRLQWEMLSRERRKNTPT